MSAHGYTYWSAMTRARALHREAERTGSLDDTRAAWSAADFAYRLLCALGDVKPVSHTSPDGMGRRPGGHELYTTADTDKPRSVCDRDGAVVLAMCRHCGAAEVELTHPDGSATPCFEGLRS